MQREKRYCIDTKCDHFSTRKLQNASISHITILHTADAHIDLFELDDDDDRRKEDEEECERENQNVKLKVWH